MSFRWTLEASLQVYNDVIFDNFFLCKLGIILPWVHFFFLIRNYEGSKPIDVAFQKTKQKKIQQ